LEIGTKFNLDLKGGISEWKGYRRKLMNRLEVEDENGNIMRVNN
jgi:hypothetical protein